MTSHLPLMSSNPAECLDLDQKLNLADQRAQCHMLKPFKASFLTSIKGNKSVCLLLVVCKTNLTNQKFIHISQNL